MFELLARVRAKVGRLLVKAGSRKYTIGKYAIELSSNHLLPEYQKNHRLYDRFLPVLCAHLKNEGFIIDVGANVGDTAVAILQTCPNSLLAIEGDRKFFNDLNKNMSNIPAFKNRYTSINCLVGTGKHKAGLFSTGTTASRSAGVGEQPTRRLDDVISDFLSGSSVALLKVDTDGYDADVIISGEQMLERFMPLIFWENQFSDDSQLGELNDLYLMLEKLGYRYLWVFDNFGNLLLKECNISALEDLNEYIDVQNKGHGTRTLFYLDILAAPDAEVEIARAAIEAYRRDIIYARN